MLQAMMQCDSKGSRELNPDFSPTVDLAPAVWPSRSGIKAGCTEAFGEPAI